MAEIIFGVAGLGSAKEAVSNLAMFYKLGLRACEIAFTYGIYIKESQVKEIYEIKNTAEKCGIELSIHAPYYINLNSHEKSKIEQSKQRILKCCKIGNLLGARKIVFHPGYYGKKTKEETYENIKNQILEMQEEIKKKKWNVVLCPETAGKLNVFGSADEILALVKGTNCSFTIDFAHLYARSQGKMSYKEMLEHFKEFKEIHCHFSGIEYGEKGEKHHKLTSETELKKLINALLETKKNFTIINESPNPVRDSVMGVRILNEMRVLEQIHDS